MIPPRKDAIDLPVSCDRDALRDEFSRCGEIKDAYVGGIALLVRTRSSTILKRADRVVSASFFSHPRMP